MYKRQVEAADVVAAYRLIADATFRCDRLDESALLDGAAADVLADAPPAAGRTVARTHMQPPRMRPWTRTLKLTQPNRLS